MGSFHTLMMSAIGDKLKEDFQLSSTQLGMLSAMYFYVYAALQVCVGIVG